VRTSADRSTVNFNFVSTLSIYYFSGSLFWGTAAGGKVLIFIVHLFPGIQLTSV
jgi:hypothetical protein